MKVDNKERSMHRLMSLLTFLGILGILGASGCDYERANPEQEDPLAPHEESFIPYEGSFTPPREEFPAPYRDFGVPQDSISLGVGGPRADADVDAECEYCSPALWPEPDAFELEPDAFELEPDAFELEPDAFESPPDSYVPDPDAFELEPDAFVPEPDAFVPTVYSPLDPWCCRSQDPARRAYPYTCLCTTYPPEICLMVEERGGIVDACHDECCIEYENVFGPPGPALEGSLRSCYCIDLDQEECPAWQAERVEFFTENHMEDVRGVDSCPGPPLD